MASIPNMHVVPAVPVPGAPSAPDAAITEIFARILVGGQAITPVDAASPDLVSVAPGGESDGEAVESGEPEEAQMAAPDAMLPFLQAQSGFPVAVVAQTAAAPSVVPDNAVPATPAAAKGAAALPQASKPVAANDESAPDEAMIVAKAVIEAKIGKPAVREGGKGKTDAVEAAIAEAPPRVTPSTTPVVERSERPAPVEASVAAPAAANIAPVQNAGSALPPFFTPAQPAAVTEAGAPAPTPQRAPAEVAVERELELARDGAWLDRLARDIARAGSEDGTMRFRLHPQTLGHMRVELSQSDQGATVRLTVETEAARTILVDAQPRLVAEARAQGVRLAGTEVDLAGSGPQTSSDPRRQADAEAQPMIRTARVRGEAAPAAGSAARSDRYA